ncbi:DUF2955 domain-containing protein (plasmid) [Rhizobium sp. 32-5/1]|uniref:DUF2955 domain-containing protein n=1 Tax=Rhizobium sp. 32-5/1 TaxID=3019602 RepID=UPI00240E7C0F|nr:DUF2955 domain-containing protein [Rhizobium sp. 32-5/1]WEZ84657.1 DUF2955 domain-containing protein [Rhizobium sp. 32-5/1]WEZ85417.1 DUF2955 domain-containing protein [Rhizobium sp. 32-5/1]
MSIDSALAAQRRKGLRVALAVSLGFTASVASGALVPFLGPLFAAQFLLSSTAPMPFAKTLGMAILIFVVGTVMSILTSWFGEHPASFLLLLGLFYFSCFVAQSSGKGGAAISLVLIVGVIVPLLGILNKELAASILSILLLGVISGAVLMWLAHAVFPEPAIVDEPEQQAVICPPDYGRALANTGILLAIMAICLTSDNLTSAAVIPITVITLLTQLDAAATGRAAFGLAIVNLFGGIIASVAYEALNLRPNLLSLFLITLVVCLFIGGRAAARSPDARVYAGALTIFLILFGLGVSPLPGSAAESFSTRILYVGAAILYTLLATALLWRPRVAKVEVA